MTVAEDVNNGFKETEIGLIPEYWKKSTIKEHCQIMTGGTPNTKVHEYWDPPEIPWMKSGEIQRNRITSIATFISQKGFQNSNARWLPQKSVVIALAGRGKTRGTTAILETDCTCNQSVVAMVPDGEISYEYLHFFLFNIYEYIRRLTGDKDRSGLNKQIIGNLPLFYPPLPEQQKIASVLSTIQKVKEKTENVIRAAKELKKSMMKHLFTYGAVTIDEAEKVPLKETEIGMIPEHWEMVKLGDYCIKPGYGLTASAIGKPIGPKFLRITDIQEGAVNWATVPYCECSQKEFVKLKLQAGDLVIARIGATTGKAFLIQDSPNAVFASYLIRVRCKDELSHAFLGHYVNSEIYWTQINSSKGGRLKQGINIPILTTLNIPLPSLPEQHQIADALSAIDEKIEAEQSKQNASDILFKTLLSLLMTGKLRVKDLEISV